MNLRSTALLAGALLAALPAGAQPMLPRVPAERTLLVRCPEGPPPYHELPADTLTEDDFALVVCERGWQPVLNRAELARAMQRGYPPLLNDAGVGGSVEVRFAVRPDGTVDSTTVRVVRATHAPFAPVAERVIRLMRLDMSEILEAAAERRFRWIWLTQPVEFRVAN